VLALQTVDDPVPGPGEVLVEVRATSLNAADWHIMRGDPYVVRVMDRATFGWRGPKRGVRGRDLAGVVVALGSGVTELAVGDEVVGEVLAEGAFAELVATRADVLARKPADLSFEHAAALPLAGTTALTGLRDGGLSAGQRLLVNGASGGVGTYAVQIGAALGAEVTAVCSDRNAAQARALGADLVVDYATTDFAPSGERYDVVLDLVGNRSLADLRRVLTADGVLLLSGGGTSEGGSLLGPIRLFAQAGLRGRFVRPQRLLAFRAEPSAAAVAELLTMIGAGTLRPVIDRTYPLADLPEAMRYLEDDHARAKVVITV
jgi:NADPH:quinone reductase-like Zn-dependent oxidoreductase